MKEKEVIIVLLTIIVFLIMLIVYLLFIRDNTKPNSRWDIAALSDGNYTYKELVNILGAPDETDYLKEYALWFDSNNEKVLIAGIRDENGKIDREQIRVNDFHIKNSLSNADIKNEKPCFDQIANFSFDDKGTIPDCR